MPHAISKYDPGNNNSAIESLYLPVHSRECGNEPRGPLGENHKGWCVRVMPSAPASLTPKREVEAYLGELSYFTSLK